MSVEYCLLFLQFGGGKLFFDGILRDHSEQAGKSSWWIKFVQLTMTLWLGQSSSKGGAQCVLCRHA